LKRAFCGWMLALALTLTIFVSSVLAGEKGGAGQKNFLWEVRSKTATAYVIGSVHLAKADIYPLSPKIEESFDKAAVLALEADPAKAKDEKLMQLMLASALYPQGESLRDHLSTETYALAERELKNMGLPLEYFNRTRPWFLALTLETVELQRLGFDTEYGIDSHFAAKAAGKKRIIELESFDYQIRMMNGFSEREQELFLLYTLKDLSVLKDGVEELMSAWRSGDTKGMEALVTRSLSEAPQLRPIFDKLFYKRNREMGGRIESFLQGKETVCVIVGAAHLVGREGIIELLRGKGYSVEQM
jgi:uncharacterized protein YbaP (TraB family)